MKLLKILGIAAAVHVLALLVILANPGCSNSKAQSGDSPITSAPAPASSSGSPAAPGTDSSVGIRYSPTRPGTAVASALTESPVSDVTPVSTYTVVRGDNLSGIAKKNGITKAELASANSLKVSATLHAGQKLIIPTKGAPAAPASPAASSPIASAPAEKVPMTEATKHTVKAGETLGGIAHRYGLKPGDLAVANNITDPKKIQPGQELTIPSHPLSGKAAKAAKTAGIDAPAAPSLIKPPPTAPADQDLDAGLKPASDVPVVKIDEGATPPKNP